MHMTVPTARPMRRILADLLLRVLAIVLAMGMILVLLPAMVEASV